MITAKSYHQATSYERLGMKGHYLDWANQPQVFKQYTGLDTLVLPRDVSFNEERLSEILAKRPVAPLTSAVTLERLSRLLHLGYALTARTRHLDGDFYYRCVPSAGALYPCELYIGAEAVSGLSAGLYHYGANIQALTPLRTGQMQASLDEAMLPLVRDARAILTFFVTAIFFRSAWKYRERAYRYHLLDTGHLVDNLALALRSEGLPFSMSDDFRDEAVNELLGLEVKKEACLAVVRIWGAASGIGGEKPSLPADMAPDLRSASQICPREIDYPVIQEIHNASAITIKDPGVAPKMMEHLGIALGERMDIPESDAWPELISYPQAVWERRSKRNFVPEALSRDQWRAMMKMLRLDDDPLYGGEKSKQEAVCVGFLTNHVEGLEPGFYVLDRSAAAIHHVAKGTFAGEVAHICLDQEWLANAAIHFVFLTNLALLDDAWGPRGYRHAMLTAGRLGQRIYLGATAMGLGCCGIGAFYDLEAARLLGLDETSSLLYLVAAGPVKK